MAGWLLAEALRPDSLSTGDSLPADSATNHMYCAAAGRE